MEPNAAMKVLSIQQMYLNGRAPRPELGKTQGILPSLRKDTQGPRLRGRKAILSRVAGSVNPLRSKGKERAMMRALTVLGTGVIVLGLTAGCGPRRNSEQVRVYEACIFQLAQEMSARASVPSTGEEEGGEVAWGQLALGEPATTLEQCECHADTLYWMVRRDGKNVLLDFYEGSGKEALTDLSEINKSAFETVCVHP